MSTLTKILIVLLTLSSIFLCGITVTYVGSANNYQKAHEAIKKSNQSLTDDMEYLQQRYEELEAQRDSIAAQRESNMADLQQENNDIKVELKLCQEDLKNAQDRHENALAIVSDYSKTVEKNNILREEAEKKVTELLDQQRANTMKINELQEQVVSQNATIAQLEEEKKILNEQKTKLQNQLDNNLLLSNKRSVLGDISATDISGIKDLDLEGLIMEVRPEDSLASISIGSAHGVKRNMKFHVVRNNTFICDVVITKVDADQASGYLDLVTKMPKAGDKVKTKF